VAAGLGFSVYRSQRRSAPTGRSSTESFASFVESVDFEAIGAACQDVATLDIDLSPATLGQYACIPNLSPELITPRMAGMIQLALLVALAGLGLATGTILTSITNSAVDGVTDGFDTAIAS
jgi:hypothetical protein